MPSGVVHAFPDANILLHFPAFDGLHWCDLCKADSVIVHITQPVIRELNKLKDTGYTKVVRKRAATVQRHLRTLLREDGTPALISKGVTIQLESRTPQTTSFEGLDTSVSDDVLIAAVLAFSCEHSVEGLLVTDDGGLGLVIKAADWNIKVIEPPANLRLPPEPDAEQKEIENLRRKLVNLEHAAPSLELFFVSGERHVKVDPLAKDIESEVSRRVSKMRQDQPILPVPGSAAAAPKRMTVRELMKASAPEVFLRDPDTIKKYNAQLDEYYRRAEDAFRKNAAVKTRLIRLEIQVENSGGAPAKDVLVDMHFPNNLKVIKDGELGRVLHKVPEPPRNPTDFSYLSAGVPNALGSLASIRHANPNFPTLSIRETNSYEVRWREPKLRQGYVSTIDPIIVLFNAEPFSFEVTYSIVADNCPITTKGSLHVVAGD